MNHSTICMILKNKIVGHVKSTVPMMSVILITLKKLGKVIEELEKLLRVRVQDQHQCRVPLSLMMIQEKAKSLHEDLKKKHSKESGGTSLNASHDWFHQLKAVQYYYCTVQDTVVDFKCLVFYVFMYYLCESYYKHIIVQYY